MMIRLEPEQRSMLADVRSRPRTLDQYYATRTLLAIDAGQPVDLIARKFGLPADKVHRWSINFRKFGIEYVIALGSLAAPRPGRLRGARSRRPESPTRRDAESMRAIQASALRMDDLVQMARNPSAEGADLEADPSDLIRRS